MLFLEVFLSSETVSAEEREVCIERGAKMIAN